MLTLLVNIHSIVPSPLPPECLLATGWFFRESLSLDCLDYFPPYRKWPYAFLGLVHCCTAAVGLIRESNLSYYRTKLIFLLSQMIWYI
jgi:hypothetical protein